MRILVVEDEHRIATSIKKGLELEKFAVDIAFDGTSGFDLASGEEYDLLVLDIMLPGIDGLEICRRLRSQNIHTPILILTAKSQVQDKVLGLNLGADDYLTKPFSFEELLARVKALIRRPKQALDTILKLNDLSLDTQSFKVKRKDKEIILTSKEFSLLEYLIRHQGQIVTKQQIINHVWDYESDILPNTIEVYIRKLRRKVDIPFKDIPPLIHTVRGFGYKIGK
jgi:two-component system, OmpR family, response regulator